MISEEKTNINHHEYTLISGTNMKIMPGIL